MQHNAAPTGGDEVPREYLYDLAPKGRVVALECADRAINGTK